MSNIRIHERLRDLRPSHKAIIALGGAALVYEALSKRGETISEGFDSLDEYPVGKRIAEAAYLYTGAHLFNLLSDKVDLFHQISKIGKRNEKW